MQKRERGERLSVDQPSDSGRPKTYIAKQFILSVLTEFCKCVLALTSKYALSQVVNLIPFNPIGSLSQFITSTNQKVTRFQKILRDIYDIRTTVRKEMGQDISGACGQLVVNLPDKRSISNAAPLTDIEDICKQ